jgi:hypothetical protein
MSENFQVVEFEHDGPIPPESAEILESLCELILEPTRAMFGALIITSGERPPAVNAATGGVCNSEHIYNSQHCAADFHSLDRTMTRQIFDWIRLASGFRFDQLILEFDAKTPGDITRAIIHVSYSLPTQRRQALIGSEHGAGIYTPAAVA